MSSPVVLPSWPDLLVEAVNKPGVISDAYRRFWNYSPGNQLLALFQCALRGLEPGPIHTFQGWRELGRFVCRGQRAITLCMPVRVQRKAPEPPPESTPGGDGAECQAALATYTRFIYRPNWFVLSQTEGQTYAPLEAPAWSEAEALHELAIDRIPFTSTNGNSQGYATQRQVAVSPLAFLPHRTLFHELAHVILGHTAELQHLGDGEEQTPRDVREVEAECVALLCCESLGLDGAVFSRGYIQHWLGANAITDRSAQRIFKAADAILRAGRPRAAEAAPAGA